jgi:tRNA threonylcarbamoyladenosine biosynthesis protein TsaB
MGDAVLCAERSDSMHGQAEILLPMVDAAMRKAGLSPAELDLIVTTVGPGSFTGIRVGLAAARSIALATSAQLIGVTCFAAVAAGVALPDYDADRYVLVALESRREDLYVQFINHLWNPVGEPAAVMPGALCRTVNEVIGEAPLLIAGDAAQRAASVVLSERPGTVVIKDSAPDAVGALRAGLRLLQLGQEDRMARPLYLRPPDVTLTSGRRQPGLGPG